MRLVVTVAVLSDVWPEVPADQLRRRRRPPGGHAARRGRERRVAGGAGPSGRRWSTGTRQRLLDHGRLRRRRQHSGRTSPDCFMEPFFL